MTGWNLPPGCTDRMIDEAYGYSSGRRGIYTVTVSRTIETTVEIEASSEEDALNDSGYVVARLPLEKWTVLDEDTSVEGPPERDPDEERDARADYERDRDR
jgi:hypothetical protein